jgi:hypothetical protein
MMMKKLVKWLAGETKVLGENVPQFRFVHHKTHMRTQAAAVGSQRLTALATARPLNMYIRPQTLEIKHTSLTI